MEREKDEIIFSYTRAQAIADGVLIDVTATASDAGIKYPTAITAAAWAEYVRVPEGVEGQDETGRLWDILWMFSLSARRGMGGDTLLFTLIVRNDNRRPRKITLKAVCGPGDDLEPVITLMLPDED